MRRSPVIIAILWLIAATAWPTEPWRDANYLYRMPVAVQDTNVDGALSNFPLLVKLTDTQQLANAKIADDRYVFYDGSGNLLYHEQLFYVEGVSYANIVAYVKVPSIAASGGASLWLYYGYDDGAQTDADNTWDANFLGVWHLDEASGLPQDSSGNGEHATAGAVSAYQDPGPIKYACEYDGANDYANLPNISIATAALTVEAWINHDNPTGNHVIFGKPYTSTQSDPYFDFGLTIIDRNDNSMRVTDAGADSALTVGINDASGNTWLYLVGRYDGTTTYVYHDTVEDDVDTTAAGAIHNSAEGLRIAHNREGGAKFNGHIAGIRLSDVDRGVDWLKFAYHNVDEADNELTWSAEESKPSEGLIPQHLRLRSPHLHGGHIR